MTEQRSLAAILVADAVGYSKLMGSDKAVRWPALQHEKGGQLQARRSARHCVAPAQWLSQELGAGFRECAMTGGKRPAVAKADQKAVNRRSHSVGLSGGCTMVDRQRIKSFCALCVARCGAVATVEDGRFVALEPDPSHPTGQALCAKGRAAPELVYSPDRLLHPLKRRRPKGDPDPGWQRIGWDEALELTAAAMRRVAKRHGPEAFAFSVSSGSTTASNDFNGWLRRLMNAYGSPNLAGNLEICGWGRDLATRFTFGVASVGALPGGAMPDIANAGCLILWGYNPSMSRLTHATAVVEGVKRGMRLIVVDPRHVGLANKADEWLRVRPGSDGALALGLANLMIERGWYDFDFVRDWTNGPMLVRADTGRLLSERDVAVDGGERRYVAWDTVANVPVIYDAAAGRYDRSEARVALTGAYEIATTTGTVTCQPVFAHYAALCRRYSPDVVEATCWIPTDQLERTARLLWESRPVAYYAWSGHEQHATVTQTARAISLLYALTGSFDGPGGNVLFPAIPATSVAGDDLPAAKTMAQPLGILERPLGTARAKFIAALDLYRAILEDKPYPVRGLLGFGANMLMAHSDPRRGREALTALDFYAHADMFMNPTAELADVILPAASCFEREALRFGFDVSLAAQSLVQLRPAVVAPIGETRPDANILFALAERLGLGAEFWNGDIEAGYRAQLAPSGVTLEALRAAPGGVHVPLQTRHRKYAEPGKAGVPQGFRTPSRKVELWSETFAAHGYPPLPEYQEPAMGPVARPDLATRYSLVLTCAKNTLFCNSQHRGVPGLRKRQAHPEVELHPTTAADRAITDGGWVEIETPEGRVRAVARFNASIDPRVVVGQHGWWQACQTESAAGYDPFSAAGANYNLLIAGEIRDPVSGTVSPRSYLCEVRAAGSLSA
jgi:anaerobic selenocysteine-containing dehydrogenase